MNSFTRHLAGALVAGSIAVPTGAETTHVNWQDLAPEVVEIMNPFESLTSDQMDKLRRIARLEIVDGAESTAEVQEIRQLLASQGLDVDALFKARLEIIEQRRRAATGVNEKLIGRKIRIPGYVLPLEMKDGKAVEFLLVPTVGACIHTPPPPANQLIHIVHSRGIEIKGLYDPVWVSGVVNADQSTQDVRYSDGQTAVDVSYSMSSATVVPYH